MRKSLKALLLTGIIAQFAVFAAQADEKIGENKVSANTVAGGIGISCGDDLETQLPEVKKDIAGIEAYLDHNPPARYPSIHQLPGDCSSIDLRKAKLHVKCTTSKGAIFERVSRDDFGEAWKGPDGVIWSDRVGSDSQYNAIVICKRMGSKLPARGDFERGEANGFREVLPNMWNRWSWSSSVDPNNSNGAFYFNGDFGNIGYGFRSDVVISVRCVAH